MAAPSPPSSPAAAVALPDGTCDANAVLGALDEQLQATKTSQAAQLKDLQSKVAAVVQARDAAMQEEEKAVAAAATQQVLKEEVQHELTAERNAKKEALRQVEAARKAEAAAEAAKLQAESAKEDAIFEASAAKNREQEAKTAAEFVEARLNASQLKAEILTISRNTAQSEAETKAKALDAANARAKAAEAKAQAAETKLAAAEAKAQALDTANARAEAAVARAQAAETKLKAAEATITRSKAAVARAQTTKTKLAAAEARIRRLENEANDSTAVHVQNKLRAELNAAKKQIRDLEQLLRNQKPKAAPKSATATVTAPGDSFAWSEAENKVLADNQGRAVYDMRTTIEAMTYEELSKAITEMQTSIEDPDLAYNMKSVVKVTLKRFNELTRRQNNLASSAKRTNLLALVIAHFIRAFNSSIAPMLNEVTAENGGYQRAMKWARAEITAMIGRMRTTQLQSCTLASANKQIQEVMEGQQGRTALSVMIGADLYPPMSYGDADAKDDTQSVKDVGVGQIPEATRYAMQSCLATLYGQLFRVGETVFEPSETFTPSMEPYQVLEFVKHTRNVLPQFLQDDSPEASVVARRLIALRDFIATLGMTGESARQTYFGLRDCVEPEEQQRLAAVAAQLAISPVAWGVEVCEQSGLVDDGSGDERKATDGGAGVASRLPRVQENLRETYKMGMQRLGTKVSALGEPVSELENVVDTVREMLAKLPATGDDVVRNVKSHLTRVQDMVKRRLFPGNARHALMLVMNMRRRVYVNYLQEAKTAMNDTAKAGAALLDHIPASERALWAADIPVEELMKLNLAKLVRMVTSVNKAAKAWMSANRATATTALANRVEKLSVAQFSDLVLQKMLRDAVNRAMPDPTPKASTGWFGWS